ncbi:MAG: mechanosensitive ion channel, partial [Bdellovibrionales bacterium]|nr:mechanosensitive ion channel [Bdellovibrionales bacterium]
TVYWLVFLLFLPAVLDALALKGLIEPVNAMVHKFLGFLPNIFAAVVIFAIGWFVARVVKKIVVNLLSSAGANRLSDKLGLKALLGDQQLSEVAGMVVYILIIIPVLISSLNSLKLEAITQPASAMLNTFLQAIPAVFAAILVLFISYVVGRVIADLVSKFLQSVGFDNLLSKLGISIRPDASHKKPSEVMGVVALIAVLLFAGIESLNLIGFQSLANILGQFTVFAGQVAFGLVIIGLGFYIANIVAKVVSSSSSPQAKFLSGLARTAVLILGFAMGLKQMGIADEIVTITFGLVLGALAIAMGIAFGLGGKDSASDLVKDLLSKFK